MNSEFKLTTREYAAYYSTIDHAAAGRPKSKYGNPNIITHRIVNDMPLPGVEKVEVFSNRYVLYVSEDVFRPLKKELKKV